MPRDPTDADVEALLALDEAAGSHEELLRWIIIARERAGTRRGRPAYELDEALIDAIERARSPGGPSFTELLKANTYFLSASWSGFFDWGTSRQAMFDRIMKKRRERRRNSR